MKSLPEFRDVLTEEEKSDYSKFDTLVRAGLANKAQLQRIHKILDKMKEERPVFNNADRMILQNLFNKMVDVITQNKQIFQQTRRVVREEEEKEEEPKEQKVKKLRAILATSDYKVSPETGRKVRAHRFKVEDVEVDAEEILEESMVGDPPFVLVLKRKALRLYPNGMRVALYYNDKLNKYFSVPYTIDRDIGAAIQAEEYELEESVMDTLHKIVSEKQAKSVKFATGETRKVDHFTASAITKVHNALNDENKKKFAEMVHKSPAHLAKASDFAFKKVK